MRQTIRTKNYNATIEIPYEKLASKHNCISLDSLSGKKGSDCNGKTLLINGCHGETKRQQEDAISLKMLQQLEAAFESDIRDKNTVISSLQQDMNRLRKQLTSAASQKEKLFANNIQAEKKYLEAVRTIKQQQASLEKISREFGEQKTNLALLSEENQSLKDRSSKCQQRLRQTQSQLGRIRQKLAVEQYKNEQKQQQVNRLSDSLQKVTANCARYQSEYRDMVSSKQQLLGKLFSMESQRNQLLKQNQELLATNEALKTDVQTKDQLTAKLRQQIRVFEITIADYRKVLQEKENLLGSKQSQLKSISLQLQRSEQDLQKSEQTIKLMAGDLSILQRQHGNLQEHYELIDIDFKKITHRCYSYERQIDELTKSNGMFVKKIVDLENSITKLELLLKEKDIPKSYEVKIEKVIDRQDYIKEIEAKLQLSNSNVAKYGAEIKGLERELVSREKELGDKRLTIGELQKTIISLKQYIGEKQKSFAWIVQRQIVKDMELNKEEQAPTYKVYPRSPSPISKPNIPHNQLHGNIENLSMGLGLSGNTYSQRYEQEIQSAIMREMGGRY